MKVKDKQELVRLLHLYMDDIVADNDNNIAEAKKHENRWEGQYKSGLKAQYEHARILATKLSVDVGKEIKSYWEL